MLILKFPLGLQNIFRTMLVEHLHDIDIMHLRNKLPSQMVEAAPASAQVAAQDAAEAAAAVPEWFYDPDEPRYCLCNQVMIRVVLHGLQNLCAMGEINSENNATKILRIKLMKLFSEEKIIVTNP